MKKEKKLSHYKMKVMIITIILSCNLCIDELNHFTVFSNDNQTIIDADIIDIADYSDKFHDRYKIIYCDTIENLFNKLVIYNQNNTNPLVKLIL